MSTNRTFQLDTVVTWSESQSRHEVGERYYAGVPATGYALEVLQLGPGQQAALPLPPVGDIITMVLAADVGASVVVGWVIGGVTTELPVRLFSVVCPPAGAHPYVRNTGLIGSPSVPVKTTVCY